MLNYIKPLATLSFWFKMNADPFLPIFYYIFFGLFGLLILCSIVAGRIWVKSREDYVLRHSAKYLKNWLLAAGVTGFLWMFFTYERAIFLSARFWLILWTAGFGLWLYFIIRKIQKLPQKEADLKKQKNFEKYLPKKK